MRKKYTLYLIHILLFGFSTSFFSAENIANYHFSRLSPSNGLSQMTITAIHQDHKGYLWFGTRNGLNRYNGYSFTTFETNLYNTNSLTNNSISSISEDSKGNLWIGTFDGLNMLNPTTNEITRYQSINDNKHILSSNIIYALHYDSENTLWIGTSNGLDKYNLSTNTFETSFLGDLLKNETINCIIKHGSELFIGTTHKGLVVYNIKNKTYTQITTQSETPISDNNIKSVFVDSNRNLWIGTYSSGINVISKDRKQTLVYDKANGLTDNHIRDFAEMSNGNIVVATFNGLDAIEHKTRKVSRYKNYDLNKGGLSHYSIISLLYDKDHTLWVGTYAGGVNYYNSSENKFTYFNPQQMLNTTVGIMADIQEVDDYIYIASEGKGLLEMNKNTQEIKYYRLTTNSDDDFAHNILKSLFWDGITLYCGTNLGMIYTFDIRSKQYQKYFDFQKHNSIYYIGKDGDGSLVVGGVNDVGFSIITKEKKLINSFFIKGLDEPFSFWDVRTILEIDRNKYFIGTRNNGFYIYDKENSTLEQFSSNINDSKLTSSLPINNVASVFKENDNKLWIGFFGGGLGCFDLSDKSIKIYDSSYGLLDLRVCMIVGDGNKTLWISTLSGLASFDTQTLKMKYYQQGNNFSINEFTLHSGARLKNNSVIFGGNNGIVMLDPAKMKFNKNIPPIVLENIYINDFSAASNKKELNTQSLDGISKISLKHNENYISIQYASLNYISAETNQYKYKLEGFDKDWVDAYDRRTAYYTNLPPGKYRFVVIGSNNDGVWNKNGASLEIVISPPFWKTWYAYLFYTLVLSIALIMLFRWYNKKENRKRQQELLEVELKNREEYHQARSNLFTNFSHELRTPLTLIFTPLQDMIRNSMGIPDPIKKNHKVIYENVTRLIRLVNNLMDFQKKESGAMPLSREQCSISSFSSEMVDSFSQLAQSRQIELVFDKGGCEFISYFDKSLIEKVFFNLLSNAFKNTPDGGQIEINLTPYGVDQLEIGSNKREQLLLQKEQYSQYIMVSVIDSGEGISEDELEKIFTPFYQIARNEHAVSGTGLGLSLSKSIIQMHNGVLWAENTNEKGAIFNFLLPLFEESESAESVVKEQSFDEDYMDEETESLKEEDTEKKYSVLVVEDNLHLRNFITDTLIGKYKIFAAKNGKEGFNLAVEQLPDLIVSDISMPIMDGMEMVKQLKENINTSHIPIIVLTAKTMAEDISGAYELGIDDYIVKPFDAHLLKIRIKNILQKREDLKQVYKKRFSLDSINTNIVSSDDMFLQKIYETINKNLDNPSYTLDDIAKEIGISRANLYRKIKMITNLSPSEFIRNFRLEMAADILRKTDIPISDVYITVGFNSLSYFSSSFKTLFGLSPSEFIDKHKTSK